MFRSHFFSPPIKWFSLNRFSSIVNDGTGSWQVILLGSLPQKKEKKISFKKYPPLPSASSIDFKWKGPPRFLPAHLHLQDGSVIEYVCVVGNVGIPRYNWPCALAGREGGRSFCPIWWEAWLSFSWILSKSWPMFAAQSCFVQQIHAYPDLMLAACSL